MLRTQRSKGRTTPHQFGYVCNVPKVLLRHIIWLRTPRCKGFTTASYTVLVIQGNTICVYAAFAPGTQPDLWLHQTPPRRKKHKIIQLTGAGGKDECKRETTRHTAGDALIRRVQHLRTPSRVFLLWFKSTPSLRVQMYEVHILFCVGGLIQRVCAGGAVDLSVCLILG